MMNNSRPIGIFDSGVGGLTVLKKLVQAIPNEDYLYFGDTARVPYGEKSKEQLIQMVIEILNWYKSKKAKAVLMACNTSSAVVLDSVKSLYDFPIFGLIQPAASHTAGLNIKKIGIIATSATVRSKAYTNNILGLCPEKEVIEISCPGLVEIVESDKINSPESIELIKKYINPLLAENVEKIILGCTHYPYLNQVINQITSRDNLLIDPADYLVSAVKEKLDNMGLLNAKSGGSRHYYVSSNPAKFVEVGGKFFSDCTSAEEIDLSLLKI